MGKPFPIANATQLKAVDADTAPTPRLVQLAGYATAGDGDPGLWYFSTNDLSAQVAADTAEALFVAPNSDSTGASGAWVRQVIYPDEPAVAYATKAILDADLTPDNRAIGLVTNDTTDANNGFYRKSGVSGAGSWIQASFDRVALVETDVAALEVLLGGAAAASLTLTQWTSGEAYTLTSVTRDQQGRITSGVVEWPDGSAGTFTATDLNNTFQVYDGYTITHTDSSQTVTQSAVTRDADGFITTQPALSVA